MVKWSDYLIAGIILCASGIIVFMLFTDPYPCMDSCIGCSSMGEYLHDSATYFYMLISIIIGIILMLKAGEKIEG